jgi:hypothetical protein
MLFQVVMKFLSRLVEFNILVNWGMVHYCKFLIYQYLTIARPLRQADLTNLVQSPNPQGQNLKCFIEQNSYFPNKSNFRILKSKCICKLNSMCVIRQLFCEKINSQLNMWNYFVTIKWNKQNIELLNANKKWPDPDKIDFKKTRLRLRSTQQS